MRQSHSAEQELRVQNSANVCINKEAFMVEISLKVNTERSWGHASAISAEDHCAYDAEKQKNVCLNAYL